MTSPTWRSVDAPTPPRPKGLQWGLVVLRGTAIIAVLLTGLIALLLLRLIEKPLFGLRRPMTPHITQTVCRLSLRLMGLRVNRHGSPMAGAGAVVTNHSSWLDILVLNAGQRITFVSKAEVATWPGIGWLARATGTLFIARTRAEAAAHVTALGDRLVAGQQLLFFPEGTSTDGLRVLPFKSTLFAAFLAPELQPMVLQPVSLRYHAPQGRDPRFYGWWGDMDLGPHLLAMLAQWRHGTVEVTYHPPHTTESVTSRKSLALDLEKPVRGDRPAA